EPKPNHSRCVKEKKKKRTTTETEKGEKEKTKHNTEKYEDLKSKTKTPMNLDGLDDRTKKILFAYPVRNVDWVKQPWRKSTEPVAILFYPKNFTRFERFLHKYLGGPTIIRRPLDIKGTRIWEMCDGKTDILHICINVDAKYKEEMEPVIPRVLKFLEMLLKRGLLRLLPEPNENASKPMSEKIPDEETQGLNKNVRKTEKKIKKNTKKE
ncbi:MAG: PqqD family protein, partial [Thermoplasmata archaeon]